MNFHAKNNESDEFGLKQPEIPAMQAATECKIDASVLKMRRMIHTNP